jgi:hypothetical protein
VYACLLFYVFLKDEDWVNPSEAVRYHEGHIFEQNNYQQYFTSLYYAVMVFGRNDIFPRSNLEIIFISISMVAASSVNAFIFGTIYELYLLVGK